MFQLFDQLNIYIDHFYLLLASSSAILIKSCNLFFSISFKFKIELVRTDKLLFLNSTIPSST